MSDGWRTTRNRRAAAGLCILCGQRPPRSGLQACAICAAQHRSFCKAWRRRRRPRQPDAVLPAVLPAVTVVHVAGYVPPKGSIAYHFVGRVYSAV